MVVFSIMSERQFVRSDHVGWTKLGLILFYRIVSVLNILIGRICNTILTVIYCFIYQVIQCIFALAIDTALRTEQGGCYCVVLGIDGSRF